VVELNTVVTNLLDSILLASVNLHCTVMQAFVRASQNGLTIGAVGGGVANCPMCWGGRASSLLASAILYNAVPFESSSPKAAQGENGITPHRADGAFHVDLSPKTRTVPACYSASMLCPTWDAICSGSLAGRFAGDGFEACAARCIAMSQRLGTLHPQ
jgi:hypothetical protein